LIELLVVITIIGILAAMLFPVFGRIRERANRAACASNLKQLIMACMAYAGDNEGRFPPGNATILSGNGIDSTCAASGRQPMGLALLVTANYIPGDTATRLFYCRSWKHPFFQFDKLDRTGLAPGYGGWPAAGHPWPVSHAGISYSYRSTFGPGFNESASPSTDNPSQTAIIADHFYTWSRMPSDPVGYNFGHREGYSVAYLDGHVGWKPDLKAIMSSSKVFERDWRALELRWQTFFNE